MLRALIKTMRLRQWPKNAFIFAAVIFDRQLSLSNLTPFGRSLAAFFLFCLLSSSVYIINDILDRESDRKHPVKRNRPIAAGKLPVSLAAGFAAFLAIGTLTLCFLLTPMLGWIALLYFGVNLAYSTWLKHIPLVDVLVIAAGFVLRVGAGVVIIQVERFSPWLYFVTTLFALYIGFGKRRAELTLMADQAKQSRKVLQGYNLPFLDHLITLVSTATIITYSLYTFSAPDLPENHVMMLTIPFVMYGIFRYLYLIHVRQEGGSPEELLLTDRPLQVVIALYGIAVLVIFYFL